MNLVIHSRLENGFDCNCAVQDEPYVPEVICGIDLATVSGIDPADTNVGEIGTVEPSVEFGKPLQDWFEMALKVESPARPPIRASWSEDEDEPEEDPVKEESEEDEQDPFEDFDEDDFDDDFDDDFEEELDDEYEIEPADDGLVADADVEPGSGEILDEEEEIGPDIDEVE